MIYPRLRISAATLAAAFVFQWLHPACAQVLLLDNFDDTSGPLAAQGDSRVDISEYRAPFGVGGDNSVGRTDFRFTLPAENITTSAPGSTDGKVAVIELSTFNPAAPATRLLGTDMLTKRNYGVGGGLRMITRMRVDAATAAQGGMVAAPFMFDVEREAPVGTQVRDEIDHELITNNSDNPPPHNTFTNVWNDGSFASGGAGQTISNPAGFNIADFHNYRTDWTRTSVKWYIDDVLVRTEASVVPDDPMKAHWNIWAPDNTFAAAFNAGLQPTAGPGTTYRAEIDRVQIERFNTNVSGNLLIDGSFENQPLTDVNTPGAGSMTGTWLNFNNSSLQYGTELAAQDGLATMKAFGPFSGGTNASGVFQNVAASPGEEFEASVWAHAPSFDPIFGKGNFTTVTLQFVNAGGAVIGSVNFSPGTNQKETPIYDGRDTLMIQDEWVQYAVNAKAPTGTSFARVNLFFIQLAPNEGGAVWFDNAELHRLSELAPTLGADFDHDLDVDGADFLAWQRNFGGTTGGDANGDGAVNGTDFTLWQQQFGEPVPPAAAVPEPAAWLLASATAMMLGIARRRSV